MSNETAFMEQEKEANLFAVCLLVPKEQLIQQLNKYPLFFDDDANLQAIANYFEVTITTIMVAIIHYKLFKYFSYEKNHSFNSFICYDNL